MNKINLLTGLTFLLIAVTCHIANAQNKQENNMSENTKKTESLSKLLNERKEASAQKFSKEKKKIYADGISSVENSGVLDKAFKIGDKAPNFTLNNQNGKAVSLYNELTNGPVILTWYRGGWCPYCNITLHFLQEKLPEFQKAGATLLALTPELPDQSLSTSEKHKLEFVVLSDMGNKIAREYGVVYKLTQEVADIYDAAFDMNGYNGDESNELPLAATYVIDRTGTIQYAFLDADYRNRAEPDEILTVLQNLELKKKEQ